MRKEYPRPQFNRDDWQCLNGEWEFEFDDDNSGVKRGLHKGESKLNKKIIVPFSYQYSLSGIGDPSQHDIVWYRRSFSVPKKFLKKRAVLHFNAADYLTDVWVNGIHAVTHEGGFSPFSVEITDYLKADENIIVVRCHDPLDECVPRGKQSWTGKPFGCYYIPNTGIWQSVWVDFVGDDFISSYTLLSDYDNVAFYGEITAQYGVADELEITTVFEGTEVSRTRQKINGKCTCYCVKLPEKFECDYAWSPEKPRLIYVDFMLYKNGQAVDTAHTRFGMRKISIDTHGKICLNNRPLYQRLVLDQGYWTESGLTPPSIEALKKDIELAKARGFNGARKHQKIEDPYYYYYAEELGFLTWCEMPSAYQFCDREIAAIVCEWQRIVSEAKNQTSNICYVPLNESWGVKDIRTDNAQQDFARSLYYLTKSMDGERLVSTNDGFENICESDILSIHDYDIRDSKEFPQKYKPNQYDKLYPQGFALFADGHRYSGQPVLFTEFGGIAMRSEQKAGAWGYNESASDAEEYCTCLTELIAGISNTEFQGYCYTQLTDVQQEINGLLYADRTLKAPIERLKKIFTAK